jgi:hypothetical protein
MAYNNYFGGYPASYQQYQAPNYQMATQPQQIQNGGFVSVRSAQEAFNYPVALGNSVTFKDETAPFIYVKTRGFSQLEEPVFEQFQLVKVDNSQKAAEPAEATSTEYALKSDISALKEEIDLLKKKVSKFKLATNESEDKT